MRLFCSEQHHPPIKKRHLIFTKILRSYCFKSDALTRHSSNNPSLHVDFEVAALRITTCSSQGVIFLCRQGTILRRTSQVASVALQSTSLHWLALFECTPLPCHPERHGIGELCQSGLKLHSSAFQRKKSLVFRNHCSPQLHSVARYSQV